MARILKERKNLYPTLNRQFIWPKEINRVSLSEVLKDNPNIIEEVFGKDEHIERIFKELPDNWLVRQSNNRNGIMIQNPENKMEHIRIMPGNLYADYPSQRLPYVKISINGQVLDNNGNLVNIRKVADTHIQLIEFNFELLNRIK